LWGFCHFHVRLNLLNALFSSNTVLRSYRNVMTNKLVTILIIILLLLLLYCYYYYYYYYYYCIITTTLIKQFCSVKFRVLHLWWGSRDSVDGMAAHYAVVCLGFESRQGQILFLQIRPDWLWDLASLCIRWHRRSFPG
jgi:hypothetical protein